MRFTLSWLKSHLDTEADLATICTRLTDLGLEVDAVTDRAAALAPFTVARVIEATRHPNADRLQVCRVDTGRGEVQVVCGAPNARTGLLGVFAPTGTRIPGTGLELKPSTIRGVESQGMLCSAREMGLGDDHDGIIELPEDAPVGAPFAAAMGLDDPLIEIKLTPDRADCAGVRGIARDLAAAGLGTLKPLDATPVPGSFPSPIGIRLELGAHPEACPLFIGRPIRGVRNGPSPRWLRDRLTSIGLRPISALVDITNFVTFDLCRPLHVFDAGRIRGDLWLRPAQGGESLLALDGRTYTLAPGMTMIGDDSGVLSLAGIMGGESTGCTEATTEVFVECALFDPLRTAATGRALGIISDARYRFERGLDPAFAMPGMEIATRLILEVCGGEAGEVAIAGAVPEWNRRLRFRPERVAGLAGIQVPVAGQEAILRRLGFEVTGEGAGEGAEREVAVPSWRADVEGEADLVEEVARVHGYDRIAPVPLTRQGGPRPAWTPAQRRAVDSRRALAGRGLVEAVTYSFMSAERAALFGGAEDESLRLANPIAADLDAMRPSVLPNLLDAVRRNADRGYADLGLFEIGPQYGDDTPAGQKRVAAVVRAGRVGGRHWDTPARPVDCFDAKADAQAVLAALGAPGDKLRVTTDAPDWYHPGRSGALRLDPRNPLAWFGELHPGVAKALGLKGPVAMLELFLDALPQPRARDSRARPLLRLPPLQPLERDFAFVVDAGVAAQDVLRAVRGAERALVVDATVFDVYTGPGVLEGHKSLAVGVTLQPVERTLTDSEIEAVGRRIVAAVAKATGGVLRA